MNYSTINQLYATDAVCCNTFSISKCQKGNKRVKKISPGQFRAIHFGAPEGTRTPDPLLRRQLLYPAELQAQIELERVMGIEPTQPAWKAGILPLNYTRTDNRTNHITRTIQCQAKKNGFLYFCIIYLDKLKPSYYNSKAFGRCRAIWWL